MTETRTTPAAATERVFESLGKVVGVIAGALSIGYVIGWQYSRDYWKNFHATWVLDLLSPTQVLADAGTLIAPMMYATLLSVLGVLTGVRERTLTRWFNVLLLLGVVTQAADFIPESIVRGNTTRLIYSLTPWCFMSAAGVGIGVLVSEFRQTNMTWNKFISNHVTWLFSVIIFTAPLIWGDGRAVLDTRAATSTLDVVTWPDEPEGDWRLGRAVDKGFIVIKLTPDPAVTEVRLLPYSVDVAVRPVNQPIM